MWQILPNNVLTFFGRCAIMGISNKQGDNSLNKMKGEEDGQDQSNC